MNEAYGTIEDFRAMMAGDEPETEVVESETNTEEVVETESNETETSEDSSELETESNENEDESDEEVVEKPVEKPKNRANERIRELNEKAKQANLKAESLENELRSLRARQAELDKLTEGATADIDPNSFETMDDYIKAVTDIKVKKALEASERSNLEKQTLAKQVEIENQIGQSFESKLHAYSEVNPKVIEASQHLAQYAENIPPEVRLSLLTDDNAAQVTWEIATNAQLIETLINANPIQSIKMIAKLSAKYDKDDVKQTFVSENKPKAFNPTGNNSKPKPVIPEVPRATSNSAKNLDKMSHKEAWEMYKKTGKRPW